MVEEIILSDYYISSSKQINSFLFNIQGPRYLFVDVNDCVVFIHNSLSLGELIAFFYLKF